MEERNDIAMCDDGKSREKNGVSLGAGDIERLNQMGRAYASSVLQELALMEFPGGLFHRAEEIEDEAVKVGFFAFIAEMAIAGARCAVDQASTVPTISGVTTCLPISPNCPE